MELPSSAILSGDELARVFRVAIEARVVDPNRRRVLLSGLTDTVISHMAHYDRPVDQLLADLRYLNTWVSDTGFTPLAGWLANAELITSGEHASFFSRVRSEVQERVRQRLDSTESETVPEVDSPVQIEGPGPPPTERQDPVALPELPPRNDSVGLDRHGVEQILSTSRNFSRVDLSGLDLTGLDFTGVRFIDVSARQANFVRSTFSSSVAERCDFSGSDFTQSSFEGSPPTVWKGVNLSNADLKQTRAAEIDLAGADLSGISAVGADLQRANLNNVLLPGAQFDGALLQGASLRGVRPDHHTRFTDARVADCIIDKASLEALSDDYGGLQRCHRMVMRIVDPVADLRTSFSGFWAWFHLAALIAFVAPYALFIARETLLQRAFDHDQIAALQDILTNVRTWAEARSDSSMAGMADAVQQLLTPVGDETSLLAGLGQFIWTGGDFEGGLSPVALLTFVLLLIYNSSRGYLLWRTKSLEHQEEVSGLPVRFEPDNKTRFVQWLARYGAWVNLGLVVVHSIVFLVSTRIWV